MRNEILILDSNIWISYVITRRVHDLAGFIQKNQITVVTSPHLVNEIRDVLARKKFRKYISAKGAIANHFNRKFNRKSKLVQS